MANPEMGALRPTLILVLHSFVVMSHKRITLVFSVSEIKIYIDLLKITISNEKWQNHGAHISGVYEKFNPGGI